MIVCFHYRLFTTKIDQRNYYVHRIEINCNIMYSTFRIKTICTQLLYIVVVYNTNIIHIRTVMKDRAIRLS